jgi:hypothetical protein
MIGKFQLKKRKTESPISSVASFFLKLDYFGRPVSLTFKGEDKFKTPIGAITTVICGILILAYCIFRFLPIVEQERTRISKNTFLLTSHNKIIQRHGPPEWLNKDPIKPKVKIAFGIGN